MPNTDIKPATLRSLERGEIANLSDVLFARLSLFTGCV